VNKPDLDIIKSPTAELMRGMVTEGFYDRSRIGLWIMEVIGREYDDMGEWARSLVNEAFPQTCTWSIPIWEFVYGIEPDDALTLEFRRQRIMTKRLQRPPINPARIEAVLSALTGCPVTVTENVAPYTFRVDVYEFRENIYDYRTALKTLRTIKPSHLSIKYVMSGKFIVTGYVGATSIDAIDTTIYPRPRNHITALPAATHISTAALASTKTTIYPIEGD